DVCYSDLQRGAEPALPVDDLFVPELAQQLVVLHGERQTLADVLAEPWIDRGGVAAAEHQVHATVGQVLQHRVVLSDLHRVVGGDQRGGGGQEDPLCLGGHVAEHGGRRAGHERGVVVLTGGEHVQAHLLGLLRDGDRSEERRVGKEGRCRTWAEWYRKKKGGRQREEGIQ